MILSARSAGIQKTDRTQHNTQHIHSEADQTGSCKCSLAGVCNMTAR